MPRVFPLALLVLSACAGGPPRVPVLIKALKSPKPEVREKAARVLAGRGEEARPALPALTETLRDRSVPVYRAAEDALVSLGEDARPGLLTLAQDPAGWLRCRAVETLARLPPSPGMVPFLVKSLGDHEPCVQGRAVEALGRAGNPAVGPLVQALKSPNPAHRRLAADALARMPADVQERATFPMIQDLRGKDEYVRGEAEILLSEMGAPAVPSLLPLMDDPDTDLRRRVTVILGRLGDAEDAVVSGLVGRLSDKDRLVRLKASMSLGQLGERDGRVLSILLRRLSAETDPTLRRGLIAAVGNMGPSAKEAVVTLISMLSDPDAEAREESVEALMKIGTFEAMDAAERHNRKQLKK